MVEKQAGAASALVDVVCEFLRAEGEQRFQEAFGLEVDLGAGPLGPFAETMVATYALYRYLKLLPDSYAKLGEDPPADDMELLARAHYLTTEYTLAGLKRMGMDESQRRTLSIEEAHDAARHVIAYQVLQRIRENLAMMPGDYAA